MKNKPRAKGNKEHQLYEDGYLLSAHESIHAKCAECNGFWVDGAFDCEVKECSLYPYHPYRKLDLDLKPRSSRPKKELTEKQKKQVEKLVMAIKHQK